MTGGRGRGRIWRWKKGTTVKWSGEGEATEDGVGVIDEQPRRRTVPASLTTHFRHREKAAVALVSPESHVQQSPVHLVVRTHGQHVRAPTQDGWLPSARGWVVSHVEPSASETTDCFAQTRVFPESASTFECASTYDVRARCQSLKAVSINLTQGGTHGPETC